MKIQLTTLILSTLLIFPVMAAEEHQHDGDVTQDSMMMGMMDREQMMRHNSQESEDHQHESNNH